MTATQISILIIFSHSIPRQKRVSSIESPSVRVLHQFKVDGIGKCVEVRHHHVCQRAGAVHAATKDNLYSYSEANIGEIS